MRRVILFLFLILVAFVVPCQNTVYKTPSGTKYHLASCRMVKNVSEEITVEDARAAGLEPCKICKPVNIYLTGAGTKTPQGKSKTVQCKGYTKQGSRCKHMTSIANGYCYQHQPL